MLRPFLLIVENKEEEKAYMNKILKNRALISIALILSIVFSVVSPIEKIYASGAPAIHQEYELDGCLKVSFNVFSSWKNGYVASIQLCNIGKVKIEDWHLLFFTEDKIANAWNVNVVKRSEDVYEISGMEWIQDISSGETIEFGYVCENDFALFPQIETLLGTLTECNAEDFSCNYFVTESWETGFNGEIVLSNKMSERLDEWELEIVFDNQITNIWNAEIISQSGNKYNIKGCSYNQNIEYNESVKIGFSIEYGNVENQPIIIGMKRYCFNRDINNDGHSGISLIKEDYYEDFDNDGIPNILEYLYGLDYNDPDSNHNGTSDYDGLVAYLKEELSEDYDNDGISDFSELMYGLNPLKEISFDDGIKDGDRVLDISVKGLASDINDIVPLVDISLYGKQVDSFEIQKISDSDMFLNSTIPGYLGNAYNLTITGDFIKATLKFSMPDSILNDESPSIFYWNEEKQFMEEVQGQFIDNGMLCVELKHFSAYLPLNREKYLESWEDQDIIEPAYESNEKISKDVVVTFDESGSIRYSDFYKVKDAVGELVDKLTEDDRVAIFTFDDIVRLHTDFVDKKTVSDVLETIKQHDGLTAIKDASVMSVNEFVENGRDGVLKLLVLLTDGVSNADSTGLSYQEIAELALDNGIIIYTIGVGAVDKSGLETLAKNTGGQYYQISDFSSIYSVFDRFILDSDVYLDSDNDGLSDYYEKKIASGILRLGSGAVVYRHSLLNFQNEDSDNDNLLDGEELYISKVEDRIYCEVESWPTVADSDGDTLSDYAEYMMGTEALGITDTENLYFEAVTIDGCEMPGIGYETWKEMAYEYYWGYIHKLVVDHIEQHNPNLRSEVSLSTGRADIVSDVLLKVWEVKPLSYYLSEKKMDKAFDQLKRYLIALKGYEKGGLEGIISPVTFPSPDGQYVVTYCNLGNGVVIYTFYKKGKKEEKQYLVSEPEISFNFSEQLEEDKDYLKNRMPVDISEEDKESLFNNIKNKDTNELSSELIIAAFIVSVSGGGGVGFLNLADDFWRVD